MRYVGDRVKRPGQLNGKSANVNNAVLNHIFPGARSAADVPARHILLIMDCDHMAKPDFFYKLAPCMLDEAVGIALAPQYFHNHVTPDCLDICHAEGIIVKQPYRYGAGMCHLTGAVDNRLRSTALQYAVRSTPHHRGRTRMRMHALHACRSCGTCTSTGRSSAFHEMFLSLPKPQARAHE